MRRAWENKPPNIHPLKWGNSCASTEASVLQLVYAENARGELELCIEGSSVEPSAPSHSDGFPAEKQLQRLLPASGFAALLSATVTSHTKLLLKI